MEENKEKICRWCQHYDPIHRNAGFCCNDDILIKGINTGIMVSANRMACDAYIKRALAQDFCISADTGEVIGESIKKHSENQQLSFDIII